MIKIAKGAEFKLKQGMALNFATCISYGIEQLNDKSLTLKYIETTRPSQKEFDPIQEIKADFNADGQITIGRLASKNMLAVGHSAINPSNHGAITKAGLYKDSSNNGTYVHLRTYEEIKNGLSGE